MKHIFKSFLLLAVAVLPFTSCVDEEEYADTPRGNFEALWRTIDERYCFFDYKASAYGLDWDEVHSRYARQITDNLTDAQLFEILGNMLGELRDGHVNLYSAWDTSRHWAWKEDYPSNISDTLIARYLGSGYRMAAGLKYRILDDNTGYIRCASFATAPGDGNLDEALMYLAPCNALIIDIRDNSGGLLTAAEKLAARFTNDELTVGYMQHKTGKGHSDFSAMKEQRLKPASGLRWQKRVAVLTNRAVYSAANEFVKYMHCCPKAIVVGDRTGGGAGLPYSSELPIGWSVRFSACPMYDRNRQSTEFGIDPDYKVNLSQADLLRGEDTIIEQARRILQDR